MRCPSCRQPLPYRDLLQATSCRACGSDLRALAAQLPALVLPGLALLVIVLYVYPAIAYRLDLPAPAVPVPGPYGPVSYAVAAMALADALLVWVFRSREARATSAEEVRRAYTVQLGFAVAPSVSGFVLYLLFRSWLLSAVFTGFGLLLLLLVLARLPRVLQHVADLTVLPPPAP